MFGEFLRPEWFEEIPFGRLIINTQQAENYIDSNKFVADKSVDGIKFPENMTSFCKRVADAKERLLKQQSLDVGRIVVTHGFVLKELCVNSINYLRFGNDIQYCEYEAMMGDKVIKYLDQPLERSKL